MEARLFCFELLCWCVVVELVTFLAAIGGEGGDVVVLLQWWWGCCFGGSVERRFQLGMVSWWIRNLWLQICGVVVDLCGDGDKMVI